MTIKNIEDYNSKVKAKIKAIFEEVYETEIQNFDFAIEVGFANRKKGWRTDIDKQLILLEKINLAMQEEVESLKMDFIQIVIRLLNRGKYKENEISFSIYKNKEILLGGEIETIIKKDDEYKICLDHNLNFELRATNLINTDVAEFQIIENGENSYIGNSVGVWTKFKTGADPLVN